MRRILVVILLAFTALVSADDFVDDVYFSPQMQLQKQLENPENITPYYNKNVREIIFITDSSTTASPDTVRAIIRDK